MKPERAIEQAIARIASGRVPQTLTARHYRARPTVTFMSEAYARAWCNPLLSNHHLSEQFGGVSRESLVNLAKMLGLPTDRRQFGGQIFYRNAMASSRKEKVIISVLRDQQKCDADIARELHCTREYVGQIRAWLNINRIVMEKAS